MKNIVLSLLFLSSFSFAQTKSIQSSKINWWGYKIAKSEASSHTGTIDLKSGKINLKNKQIIGGEFIFDMNSITATDLTGEYQTKFNNHLKNDDFFDVEKYPTATFKLLKVRKIANKYLLSGLLTVKNKTNPITFHSKITNLDDVVRIVSDKFSFDRQKFGVSYKSTMKDIVLKDDVDFMFDISLK